jgi:hypothetical protein
MKAVCMSFALFMMGPISPVTGCLFNAALRKADLYAAVGKNYTGCAVQAENIAKLRKEMAWIGCPRRSVIA